MNGTFTENGARVIPEGFTAWFGQLADGLSDDVRVEIVMSSGVTFEACQTWELTQMENAFNAGALGQYPVAYRVLA